MKVLCRDADSEAAPRRLDAGRSVLSHATHAASREEAAGDRLDLDHAREHCEHVGSHDETTGERVEAGESPAEMEPSRASSHPSRPGLQQARGTSHAKVSLPRLEASHGVLDSRRTLPAPDPEGAEQEATPLGLHVNHARLHESQAGTCRRTFPQRLNSLRHGVHQLQSVLTQGFKRFPEMSPQENARDSQLCGWWSWAVSESRKCFVLEESAEKLLAEGSEGHGGRRKNQLTLLSYEDDVAGEELFVEHPVTQARVPNGDGGEHACPVELGAEE